MARTDDTSGFEEKPVKFNWAEGLFCRFHALECNQHSIARGFEKVLSGVNGST